MPRVKRGNVRRAKRKKLLARAKGFYQTKSKLYRSAKESVDTALKYAFVGRRRKKRDFRRLWVVRINAAARENGLTYGQLIAGLKAAGQPDRPQDARRSGRHPAGGVCAAGEDRRRREAADGQAGGNGTRRGSQAEGPRGRIRARVAGFEGCLILPSTSTPSGRSSSAISRKPPASRRSAPCAIGIWRERAGSSPRCSRRSAPRPPTSGRASASSPTS